MEVSLQRQNILFAWISWHFYDVPKFILKTWRTYLIFNLNYFSTIILLRTLFSPWRQYKWSAGRGFDIPKFFEALFSNLISRILGAMVRSILIVIGLSIEILIIFVGLILFLGWFILPILLILGIYYGFNLSF
jgi:hypothetical protein